MTKPYSTSLKQQLIARLTGVNAVSAAQLARETGIKQQNLSRWLSEARSCAFGAVADGTASVWTVEQKARLIAHAAALGGDELSRYLESEGVEFARFKCWRIALEEASEVSVSMAKRIGQLERELARKERALAEAATRWVLREPIQSEREEEDRFEQRQEEEATANDSRAVRSASADTALSPPLALANCAPRQGAVFRNSEMNPQAQHGASAIGPG